MRIVHLSTSDMGGGGIAAKRLHLALLASGADSFLLTKFSFGPSVPRHRVIGATVASGIKARIFRRFRLLFPFFFHDPAIKLAGRKPGREHFSFPFPGERLRRMKEIESADIIHLHWVADGMLDYKEFFTRLDKKIVWTLHDMNPFTGGCHHADESGGYLTDCADCPQLEGTADTDMARRNFKYKNGALSGLKDRQLRVVCPSSWLLSCSQKSSLFKRFTHYRIPNIIGSNIFTVQQKKTARERLEVPHDSFVVLFVANDIDNPRKGITSLLQALDSLSDPDILICTVGKGVPSTALKHPVRSFGFVSDEREMAEIYNVADVFILPSVAENFPNTVVESLLCGTPVIASRTGGIPEQINGDNGLLVSPGDIDELREAIGEMYRNRNRYPREKVRESAIRHLSDELVVHSYLKVYNDAYEKS